MTEPNEARLLTVAASISDGAPIDWDNVDQERVDTSRTGVLRELRLLDRIATFHRKIEAEPELQAWGHLKILDKIGDGAFGAVYRATDTKLQRDVALKLLWPAGAGSSTDPSRTLKEARLLARVRHPNVVTVHGADQIDGRVGLWMEFVNGRTLADTLRTHGPFSAREAALIGLDLCRALAAVHLAGLIHGDIKPQNVMREQGGRTVLMDFGVSCEPLSRYHRGGDDLAGTPLYLAPEVFDGRPRTQAVDIYSLGVLLYHLVTGAYPVDGQTLEDVKRAHQNRDRNHLRDLRPDLPEEFVQTVERALALDPNARYQSAGVFEAALARFLGSPTAVEARKPPMIRPWRMAAAAATVVALAGAAYFGGLDWLQRGAARENGQTTASSAPVSGGGLPGAEPTYQIDTALYREAGGQDVRLRPGARVAPGDKLFVELTVSVPAYVYIVNEDEHGESYLLYPLPDQNATNPLPAGKRVKLPGTKGGQDVYWQVTSAGGREHFIIFASPAQLPLFDQMFAALPSPETGKPIQSARLSNDFVSKLRGIGGLTATPETPGGEGPLSAQFATRLADTEETARGLWVRQFTVENPGR